MTRTQEMQQALREVYDPQPQRWNGTARETQPGELLPVSDDPAVGRNGRWYAVGLVLACFVIALVAAQAVR